MKHEIYVGYSAPEHCPELGRIMAESFRSAFSDFISQETLDRCAVAENCAGLLANLPPEMTTVAGWVDGKLMGLLVFSRHPEGRREIEAIHSLPESWGRGLGRPCWRLPWTAQMPRAYGPLRRISAPGGSTKSTASASPAKQESANSTEPSRSATNEHKKSAPASLAGADMCSDI